ncbi:hypothetical protein CR105_02945 [Massilia eurypsychrophila]|jgi:hypothetical protein|uniref:Uncharacterized protein n=1 Tax=Massilia eurypsychrophila TaxID=1485217 RepID=A0A2G8TJ35_9BURK|nr:hypothetical protein [Massilia eurypsychrophila]PIL46066.1 hypothetical protein CR105_02945 [Massilia eurypsychrophila]
MSYSIRFVFAAMVLSGAAAAHAQDPTSDPLRALLACPYANGLKAPSVERLPGNMASRTVQTSTGPMQVSVADGYRMMLAFPDTAPLVNLKLERSQPGKLAADRTAILAQMTSFAATPGTKVAPFKVIERQGVEIMTLNNPTLNGGGVISIYTLISEKNNVIATAYLLDQKPAQRKFQTYEQYLALRDEFIYALALCMAEM